jgi:3'(2'), 5'-bisphosphate nucleotidase
VQVGVDLAGDNRGHLHAGRSHGAQLEVDAYLHAGGQYEWDSAAPVAVAVAAGAHASRIDGSPLRYNQPNPLLPDLLVCRSDLAADLLDAIRRASVTVSS